MGPNEGLQGAGLWRGAEVAWKAEAGAAKPTRATKLGKITRAKTLQLVFGFKNLSSIGLSGFWPELN